MLSFFLFLAEPGLALPLVDAQSHKTILDDPGPEIVNDPPAPQASQTLKSLDQRLRETFPGQFLYRHEINQINERFRSVRSKREVDMDICCKT